MSIPTRLAVQFAGAPLLLFASLLRAQFAETSTEPAARSSAIAAPPAVHASALAESSPATTVPEPPGTLAGMENQLQPVEEVLSSVLRQYRASGNRDGEANTLCALGNSYNRLGQQQKAIEQFQQALAIYRQTGDKQKQANALSRIGDVYHGWGFPDLAVRFYRDALQLQVQIGDKSGRAMILNNLGVMYLSLSNRKKALDYLDQARAAYHDDGDGHGETLTLINMGAAENFLAHDARKAITLLQQAISELEPMHDRSNQADAYELLGVVWAGIHKPETAELNFDRALELYRGLSDAHGEARVFRHMRSLLGAQSPASAQ